MRLGYFMGALVVFAACGGEAVIDPPLGSGGSGSTSTSDASSTSSFGVTVTTSTGMGMLSCEELNARYRELIDQAKQCFTDITAPQCQSLVPDDLFCPCETSVDFNDNEVVQAIGEVVATFNEQGCLDDPVPCPPVACVEVVAPSCVDDRCVDTP